MATLTAEQIAAARQLFVDEINNLREPTAINKADLFAAFQAADAWADANAASYNAALPTAARTALTAKQKARLLSAVIRLRYEAT